MKLNCDLGEREEHWYHDQKLIPLVDQINISCGAHAGSEELILKTLLKAKELKKSIGIHPGYADKANFGRFSIAITKQELQSSLEQQLELFLNLCQKVEVSPSYLKPHGALYHDCQQEAVFDVLLLSMDSLNMDLPILLMKSPTHAPSKSKIWKEAFIDRLYKSQNELLPRTEVGGVIQSSEVAFKQYQRIVRDSEIETASGECFKVQPDSLCIHGDSRIALELLEKINKYRASSTYES